MFSFIKKIQKRFTPLQQIIGLGILFRLIAVVFSKGFGWFDDHFLIIEAAQSWADGQDYNHWLPSIDAPGRQAQGHPLFYAGIHFVLFKLFAFLGINDPQNKMTIIRLLHAFYSLTIISYGYKIAEYYSGKKTALYTAGFLSLFWFMPFLSVRNLAEFVCIPPLLMATWLLIKEKKIHHFFFAGILLGIAFSIRFQSIIYSVGIAVALLNNKITLKYMMSCLAGFVLLVSITQGLTDYLLWHKAFAELTEYIHYNLSNAGSFGYNIWHMYFDVIVGILIPPLSFLLFGGWAVTAKKLPILFWPVLFFLVFHTVFPNKQERFILTIIPSLIIAGTIGMFYLYERFKPKINSGWLSFSKYFVLTLNTLLLIIISFTYSKRNRCEAMTYLYKQPDLRMVMIDDSNKENDFTMPPLYYLGKWHSVIGITKQFTTDSAVWAYHRLPDEAKPNYLVFWKEDNLNSRVEAIRKKFNQVNYVATIQPGLTDVILNRLNPNNDNETAYIYTLGEPVKK